MTEVTTRDLSQQADDEITFPEGTEYPSEEHIQGQFFGDESPEPVEEHSTVTGETLYDEEEEETEQPKPVEEDDPPESFRMSRVGAHGVRDIIDEHTKEQTQTLELMSEDEVHDLLMENPERGLLDYEPHEVKSMWEHGFVEDDDAEFYVAMREYMDDDLFAISPESVRYLYGKGILSDYEVEEYLNRHESPVSYYLKTIPKDIVGGILKGGLWSARAPRDALDTAADEGHQMWRDMYEDLGIDPEDHFVAASMSGKLAEDGKDGFDLAVDFLEHNANTLYRVGKDLATPHSTPSALLQGLSQFATPFGAAGRIGRMSRQGSLVRNQLMQTSRMQNLAARNPKAAEFVARMSEDAVRGAVGDYSAFDPHEGRLADLLLEVTNMERRGILEYLETDPEGRAGFERMKHTIEGGPLGVALDGIVSSLRYAKGKLWNDSAFQRREALRRVQEMKEKHGIDDDFDPLDTSRTDNYDPELIRAESEKMTNIRQHIEGRVNELDDGTMNRSDLYTGVAREIREGKNLPRDVSIADIQKFLPRKTKVDPEQHTRISGQQLERFSQMEPKLRELRKQRANQLDDELDPAQRQGETEAELQQRAETRRRTMPRATEKDLDDVAQQIRDGYGVEDIGENRFLDVMELPEGAKRMAKKFREHFRDDMYHMRVADWDGDPPVGRRVTRKQTVREASREFAKLTNMGTEETMQAFRHFFKGAQEMPKMIGAMHRFLDNYMDAIDRVAARELDLPFPEQLRLVEHMKNAEELVSMVFGVRSSVGRSLDIYNVRKFGGSRFDSLRLLDDMDLREIEGNLNNRVKNAIRMWNNAKDKPTKQNVAKALHGDTFMHGMLEFVQANLLWNPATHITNIMGTSIAMANNSLRRYSGLRMHARKTGNPEVMKEWEAFKHGMRVGTIEALRLPGVTRQNFYNPKDLTKGMRRAFDMDSEAGNMWKALFSGELQLDPLHRKAEGQSNMTYRKLDRAVVDNLDKWGMNNIGVRLPLRTLVKLPFLPFHGLSAVDEFTKNIGYFSEYHALAARKGIDAGLTGQRLQNHTAKILKNESRDIHHAAIHKGREITFTDELGPLAQWGNKALHYNQGTELFKIAAVPFYKVIINLAKYAGRNSPFGWMSKRVRDQMRAGGRQRYEAITGMLAGTGAAMATAGLAANGLITGRVPPGMQDTWNNYGIQEYSIRLPGTDRWISYVRFDPLSTILGTTVDGITAAQMSHQYFKHPEEADDFSAQVMVPIILAFSEPILNKTFMESLQDTTNALLRPERQNWNNVMLNQAAKFVPFSTAGAHYNRVQDEWVRETNDLWDVINQRFPGRRDESIIRRHNIYGTKEEADPAWPVPVLGAYTAREETHDPVAQELMRLGHNIRPPEDEFVHDGVKVELEPEEYARFNDIIAKFPVQDTLVSVINSDAYQAMYQQDKRDLITNIVSNFRRSARQVLFAETDRVRQEYIDEAVRRSRIMAGMEEDVLLYERRTPWLD